MSAPPPPPGNGERDLASDVERIHRPLMREPREPEEGREAAPWWVVTTVVLALFWGGFYLGRFGGDFRLGVHQAFPAPDLQVAREVRESELQAELDPIAHGESIYDRLCRSCHQPDGRGVPGAFPPLVGSEWVTGDPRLLVNIVLHGLMGPIEVAGSTFDGAMPAWGAQLDDEEVAAVASFVRQWQANEAPPIEEALVRELRAAHADRAQPWTGEALRAAVPGEQPAGDAS